MNSSILSRPQLLLAAAAVGVMIMVVATFLLLLRVPVDSGLSWLFTASAALTVLAISRISKLIKPDAVRSTVLDDASRN